MGFKKFDPRWEHKIDYPRHGKTVYCPFNPLLKVMGEDVNFMVNPAMSEDSLQFDHFKELGRWINVNLNEVKIKKELRKRFLSDLNTIELSGVNGLCKLFLYEHFAVSRLSWVFMVQDLSLSFAQELDSQAIPKLKKWAGLFRGSDLGTLFRRREHLTSVSLLQPNCSLVWPECP